MEPQGTCRSNRMLILEVFEVRGVWVVECLLSPLFHYISVEYYSSMTAMLVVYLSSSQVVRFSETLSLYIVLHIRRGCEFNVHSVFYTSEVGVKLVFYTSYSGVKFD